MLIGCAAVLESCLGKVPRVRSAVVEEVAAIPAREEAIAVLLLVLVEDEER